MSEAKRLVDVTFRRGDISKTLTQINVHGHAMFYEEPISKSEFLSKSKVTLLSIKIGSTGISPYNMLMCESVGLFHNTILTLVRLWWIKLKKIHYLCHNNSRRFW
jgi:hypothetical protein